MTDPARRLVEEVLDAYRETLIQLPSASEELLTDDAYEAKATAAAPKLARMLNFALDRLEEVDDLFGLKEINEMAEEE